MGLYTLEHKRTQPVKTLGESPRLRIIDFLLDNKRFDFTKKEVIEAMGMSKQTFYKYFSDIEPISKYII